MPPKRRLRHADSDSSEDTGVTKRAKVNEQSDDGDEGKDLNSQVVFKEIIDHLYNQEDGDGRPLWKMFDTLPSKDEFPVYYDYIEIPIDLKTIKKKIQTRQYDDIEELEKDIMLVFANARAFNEPRSQISKDATCLKRAYLSKKTELNRSSVGIRVGRKPKLRKSKRTASIDSEISELSEPLEDEHEEEGDEAEELKDAESTIDTPSKTPNKNDSSDFLSPPGQILMGSPKDDGLIDGNFEHNVFSTLYNVVVGFSDSSGRKLSASFIRLPIRRSFPDYYECVKKPLSLGKIRTKIKASYYNDLNILEKDFNIVFDNAQLYHAAGSQQNTDAMQLQLLMRQKKSELEKTSYYIEMREGMPKRGRPKLLKSDSADETHTPTTAKKRKLKESSTPLEVQDLQSLKQKLLQLYNCVLEYKDSESRLLSEMFVELPDKSEYPDYYKVIPNPIDMKMINKRLQASFYSSEDEFIHDFEVLFQNARHFNEEGSEIYEDSIILEKALKKKRRWLMHLTDGKTLSPLKTPRQSRTPTSGQFSSKCQELLSYIKNYTDENGRNLAQIFERLPSKLEYPEYYQLIKKTIDLAFISSRVNKYTSINDLEQDLLLMFDNACHFNDPDSQIYKDALTLLRGVIKKKQEIEPDVETALPDVKQLVQNLLNILYTNVMNHKDEEGRCYSDSLLEVSCNGDPDEQIQDRKPISLLIIGQLLKLGFYKRLDHLQEDMFAIFKRARKDGRTDSEMYEDACELQIYFILERDRLTKDGLRLMSPAVNFTAKSVQHDIDDERKEKQHNESLDDDENDESDRRSKIRSRGCMTVEVQPDEDGLNFKEFVEVNGVSYRVGDYVYVKPEEANRPPHIVSIDKIWSQKDGLQGVYGSWFYRPEATFHLASRKFMEKEVFRSHHSSYILLSGIIGKCYVMSIKEYSKLRPEGLSDEEIYVCESRYNAKTKTFRKIKTFLPAANHIKLCNRVEPLVIKRVSSIFAATNDKRDRNIEKENVELTTTDGYEFPKENCAEIQVATGLPGCTYFEKFITDSSQFKLGDGVYVQSDERYLFISKIERIWTNPNGETFFQGNWYIQPEDTKHIPTQLFYRSEIFESNIEEAYPISKVVGKCAILNMRDYQYSRPTEVDEKDIYLCSAHYNENEMKFRRNVKGFKRMTQPSHIQDDEYWYFEQPYNPKRRPSLWLMTDNPDDYTPKEDQQSEQEVSGYLVMKKEHAAMLMKDNPDLSLDQIKLQTEQKWESLTKEDKDLYKARAKSQGLLGSLYVHDCVWSNCDYQFEDLQDLMVHVMEGSHIVKSAVGVYPCEWRGCDRNKDGIKRPFPTHSKLVRHIREIHFKHAGKYILASEKKRYYFPRHQTCEEGYRSGASDRASSRASSTVSPLSPNAHMKQAMLQHKAISMFQNLPTNPAINNLQNSAMQMQAGMFAPFRMTGQTTPQAIMQQQIFQQQIMLQQRLNAPPPPPTRVPPLLAQSLPQQHPTPPLSTLQQPVPPPVLSIEQQQILMSQVQRQQQEIQKLQQKVQQLTQQQQQQKASVEETPVFVAPPVNTQKLRHSEAYLRYIESLRDNRAQMSNWKELADEPHNTKTQQPLPVHWLANNHGFASATDALWALRDHMLRDAVALSKYI